MEDKKMKPFKIMIALALMISLPVSAQMRMHQRMMQDSSQYGHMQGNRGMGNMMMPGCMYMMQGNMMGQGMMGQGMMGRGMMGQGRMGRMNHGMMGSQMPMQRYMRMVNLMPFMGQKLSLTDEQVSQLIDMRTAFKKQQVDFMADLAKQRMKMQDLVKNEASTAQLKEQLQTCSDIRINLQVAAYETFNKMKGVLNDNQKEQLQGMMMRSMNDGWMMNRWK